MANYETWRPIKDKVFHAVAGRAGQSVEHYLCKKSNYTLSTQ